MTTCYAVALPMSLCCGFHVICFSCLSISSVARLPKLETKH